jgi:hypothetical protein
MQHHANRSSSGLAFLATALLALPAVAGHEPASPPAAVKGAAGHPVGHWEAVEGARRGGAWAAFEERFGAGWSVFLDHATGSPSLLVGPGLPLGSPIRADEAGIARARALLEELADLFGVDDPSAFELERAVSVPGASGHEIVTINFKQTWRGFDVRHQSEGGVREHLALVKFQFDGTLGRAVLLGSDAVPGLAVPSKVLLDEAAAVPAALAASPGGAAAAHDLAVRSYVSVRERGAFLAREVEVVTQAPAHQWKAIFDAGTGELAELRDELREVDVIGNVSAGNQDFPGGTFSVKPARSLRVSSSGGGSAATDAAGNFTISNPGTTPVTLTGRFAGDWSTVNDQSGNGNLSFSQSATPGTPATIVLNPTNVSEFETAESSAYHWTTTVRFFIQARIPGFSGLAALATNVNIANTCNAFWNGSSINFFRAGGGCNNTAISEVVQHEYGHGFHQWFHGSTSPGGFSEGIGDHLGLYSTGQRIMGRNFGTGGGLIRDYRPGGPANNTQWPCSGCAVHTAGQVWAGFCMDVRDNLIATLGMAPGVDRAERITIAQYLSNPANEPAAVTGVFVQDDNDGNLANGTPNCTSIVQAATRHALPLPPSLPTSCGAPPPPSPVGRYRTPVAVSALNSTGQDYQPTLDDSQLNVWFSSNRAGTLGGQDIFFSSRTSIAAAWNAPSNVSSLNTASNEFYPSVSGDGLTMVLSTDRPGGLGSDDLWVSTRPNTASPWGAATNLTVLNSATVEDDPTVAADGLEIVFTSDRSGSLGGAALWRSTRPTTGSPWAAPTRISELDSSTIEHSPALSQDGLKLFFSRSISSSDSDFVLASRTARGQPWTVVRTITEINTGLWDFNGDDASDGFSFYYSQTIGSASDIYRADLILPLLLGPSSIGVGQTLTLTLRRDPGNVGVIVIGVAIPPIQAPPLVGDVLINPILPLVSLAHDLNGRVSWSTGVPNIVGSIVSFQGVSQDAGVFYLSNRRDVMVTP